MKIINDKIIISEDLWLIINGFNALDFSFKDHGISIPSTKIIELLRKDFSKQAQKVYGNVCFISEDEMKGSILNLINNNNSDTIISLDKVYTNGNVFATLDCTRLEGSKELVSRFTGKPIDSQISLLSKKIKEETKSNKITIVDDIIFSGESLIAIKKLFEQNGIVIKKVLSGLTTNAAMEFFKTLNIESDAAYLMSDTVEDEICERDFYFGIPQSGMTSIINGKIFKKPYFLPFGNPIKRASVPQEFSKNFSTGCLCRSKYFWEETEKNSNGEILIKHLPEKIINTVDENRVVSTLEDAIREL